MRFTVGRVDARLNKVCDRRMPERVSDYLSWVQPRGDDTTDEGLADIHGMASTSTWRGEEPFSAQWQCLHIIREKFRKIGRNRLRPSTRLSVGHVDQTGSEVHVIAPD
jgi:hypothetical protein